MFVTGKYVEIQSPGEVEPRIIGEDKLTVAGVDNLLGINVIIDSQCFSSGNI